MGRVRRHQGNAIHDSKRYLIRETLSEKHGKTIKHPSTANSSEVHDNENRYYYKIALRRVLAVCPAQLLLSISYDSPTCPLRDVGLHIAQCRCLSIHQRAANEAPPA